jgi:F-type H+-transporting ATPase subunit epsilon
MSKQKITFKILTPQRPVYDSEVEEISVPAKGGRVKVFARHVGMVSLIDSGEVIVMKDGEQIVLHVHKGILEVKPGSIVTILADSADHVNELDEEKITAAKERAEKALEDGKNLSEVEFARLEDGLIREISKLKTFKKYR